MTTVKEILGAMQSPTDADKALIERAYEFGNKAHEGHMRYSGEPYWIHPSAVAKQLAEIGMDAPTIAAGLLHDAIEDARASEEDVRKEFGPEVLFLVDGVTKLGKHRYRGAERHAESLRRLLVATSEDVRVLIVKLADRYHNMTTLEHVPEHKRSRIALETLEIFCPLADRLGMGRMKRELEDMAFPYVDKDAYEHTLELRSLATKETEDGLMKVKKELQKALVRKGLRDFETSIRMKGLWSLFKKLQRKNDDITEIHDIAALRIVVKSIDDCYAALGVIHSLWKPLPGEFKDYIAFPKPNGYQSLHTTVMTAEAGVVEVQVRSGEMHRHARFGIASHMSYKQLGKEAPRNAFEMLSFTWIRDLLPSLLNFTNTKKPSELHVEVGNAGKKKPQQPAPRWLTDIADAHASIAESSDFVAGLKEDFFSYRLFVFTPKGDVVDLPTNSTPVDFAYAIHSDLGNHLQGAKVNGKMVSFDTPLHNGDIVEILTRDSAHPSKKWIDYARTSMARKQIRAALEVSERGTMNAPVKVDTRGARRKRSSIKSKRK